MLLTSLPKVDEESMLVNLVKELLEFLFVMKSNVRLVVAFATTSIYFKLKIIIMDFVRYKNLSGRSNVAAYRINYECIDVVFFGSTKIYRYSYKSAGKPNIDELIRRANQGYGLNSYINTNCKYLYE